MKRLIKYGGVGILVLALVSCAGPNSVTKRQVSSRTIVPVSAAQQSDFEMALALMKKRSYAKATPILESIIKENNRLVGVHINLAIAYMKLAEDETENENLQKAEQALLQAISLNKREAVAHFQLGLLYRQTGRFEQAQQSYRQAIRYNANYSMAYFNLGVLCDIFLQQAECAIEQFEAYRVLVPADTEKINLWLSDIRRRAGIPEPVAPQPASLEPAVPEPNTEQASG